MFKNMINTTATATATATATTTATKYKCINCKKEYTRKASIDKHMILCDFKSKSKAELIIEEEESSDKPTYDQLV